MTLEQAAGKILLAAMIPGGLAVAGWLHNDMSSLHAAIDEHSKSLAGISWQMTDLTIAVRDHNTATDTALNKLLDDDQKHTAAIAMAQAQLEDIHRSSPRVEQQNFTPVPSRAPNPIPALGNAIQHLFSPAPHHWRRHP